MPRRSLVYLACGVLVACAPSLDAPTVLGPDVWLDASTDAAASVTTSADAGPGSFRQAVLDANSNPAITRIVFRPGLGVIAVATTVTYSGSQTLTIVGADATIDGSALGAGAPAFMANGGASLTLRALTVQNAPGTGVTVAVPDAAVGTLSYRFENFRVSGNGRHGVLINDQKEYFNDPDSPSQEGSAASLDVRVTNSQITGNGLGALDNDGFRVNEGGLGSIVARVTGTTFSGNGADGLELDERFDGDARFTLINSSLTSNGAFDVVADPDDGIDVDEAGNGSIVGDFTHVIASFNSEQGVDLNENDAGDLRVDMTGVTANDNAEEGIEFEEDDDFAGGGHIVSTLVNVTTLRNGAAGADAGLKLREKGIGNLAARVTGAVSSNNSVAGMLFREDSDGNLRVNVTNVTTGANADDGIEFDENGIGHLQAEAVNLTSTNNTGAGIKADQQLPGNGRLDTRACVTSGNGGGPIVAVNVDVFQIP
jgi:hypothetical protein